MIAKYEPDRFSDLAGTAAGKDAWSLLNDQKSIDAMIVASDLGRPAAEAVAETLLQKLGEAVLPDRMKQMIGHMIKKIMEREGLVVDQSNVKLNSVPFATATRYRRPDWKEVHVYEHSADPGHLYFTATRSTAGLPTFKKGKWRFWKTFSTPLSGSIMFGVTPHDIHQELKTKSFARRPAKRLMRAV